MTLLLSEPIMRIRVCCFPRIRLLQSINLFILVLPALHSILSKSYYYPGNSSSPFHSLKILLFILFLPSLYFILSKSYYLSIPALHSILFSLIPIIYPDNSNSPLHSLKILSIPALHSILSKSYYLSISALHYILSKS